MLTLFPYTLIRVAGGSFDKMAQFKTPELDKYLTEIELSIYEYEQFKLSFSEELLSWIKIQENPKIQNILQNFRRDIYNDRAYKERWENDVIPLLPLKLQSDYKAFRNLQNIIKQVKNNARNAYLQSLYDTRKILQEQSKDPILLKGLALAAPDLLTSVSHFVKQDPVLFKKREINLENSLLKYISRYRSKTSPFSTFTTLTVSNYSEQKRDSPVTTIDNQVKSNIRLNSYLFYYLRNVLLQYDSLTENLLIRLNPTIHKKESSYSFVLNTNNVESFQNIIDNPVVELIKNIIDIHREGISKRSLCLQLTSYIDADYEELSKYIKQLIQTGFLEYNLGVSGTDPSWDESLISVLMPFKSNVLFIDIIISLLHSLRSVTQYFGQLSGDKRLSVLQEMHHDFRQVYNQIHEAIGLPAYERQTYEEWLNAKRILHQEATKAEDKIIENENSKETNDSELIFKKPFLQQLSTTFSLQARNMLYEDCIRDMPLNEALPESEVKKIIIDIDSLLNSLPAYDFQREEKLRMYQFYKDNYPDSSSVNVLTFYEDYYREVKIPIETYKSQINKKNNIDDLDYNKLVIPRYFNLINSNNQRSLQLNHWTENLIDILRQQDIQDTSRIHISQELLDKLPKPYLSIKSIAPLSLSSFIQFYNESGQLKGVVNAVFLGYGKMIGRFLHLFQPEVTDELRFLNHSVIPSEEIAAENTDASIFNANLHPFLLPVEIQSPGSQSSLPTRKQLPVHEFIVEPDETSETLILKHQSTGKIVTVYDLCFQTITGRSKLYQLLEVLNQKAHPSFFPLIKAINTYIDLRRQQTENSVTSSPLIYPRITFNSNVILQRQSWYFNSDILPKQNNHESEDEYFYRVRTWSKIHDLPTRVFVQCEDAKSANNVDKLKINRDDYKPQFIDFQSPLLVNLFAKIISRVSIQLKIVEMLPVEGNLLQCDSKTWITEHLVQWYYNNLNN